ncbi:Golgi reassembly-stacking protein 2-like isoform X2 [Ptychodera flava]|uniref:Golgi reassembly-stacking protein 2-like isoform X2 n=1 Tax=Ptychodera flava TaxID=63121 RepID=UPI00396A9F59
MGGSASTEVPGGGTEGYHVLRVQENSPGHKAGLEAFFDFVVAIGNQRLDKDNDILKEILKANMEKSVRMLVYSSKSLKTREVMLTPSNAWGGQGLLGVSIRFCSFEGANENVWHVLDVQRNSPADFAGLRSNTDYIIGADSVLHESEDLFSLIESHEGRPLKLYVYNTETDGVREVTLTPNSNWGGDGSIGCGIGYGYLHRIPTRPFDGSAAAAPSQPVPSPVPTPGSPAADGFSEVSLSGSPQPVSTAGIETGVSALSLGSPTAGAVPSSVTSPLTAGGTPTIPVIPSTVTGAAYTPASPPSTTAIPGMAPMGVSPPTPMTLPNIPGLPNMNIQMPPTQALTNPSTNIAAAANAGTMSTATPNPPFTLPSSIAMPPVSLGANFTLPSPGSLPASIGSIPGPTPLPSFPITTAVAPPSEVPVSAPAAAPAPAPTQQPAEDQVASS